MASYASDVKKELTSIEVHPEHAKAELAAFANERGFEPACWPDESGHRDGKSGNRPADFSLIKTAYGFEPQLIVTRKMKLKKNHQYLVRVAQQVPEIMEDLQIYSPEKAYYRDPRQDQAL